MTPIEVLQSALDRWSAAIDDPSEGVSGGDMVAWFLDEFVPAARASLPAPPIPPDKKWVVIEAQEATCRILWRYEVEADDAEHAIAQVRDGSASIPTRFTEGEPDYDLGRSGFAATLAGGNEDLCADEADDALDAALREIP